MRVKDINLTSDVYPILRRFYVEFAIQNSKTQFLYLVSKFHPKLSLGSQIEHNRVYLKRSLWIYCGYNADSVVSRSQLNILSYYEVFSNISPCDRSRKVNIVTWSADRKVNIVTWSADRATIQNLRILLLPK